MVEYIVVIDVTRVRFPADAHFIRCALASVNHKFGRNGTIICSGLAPPPSPRWGKRRHVPGRGAERAQMSRSQCHTKFATVALICIWPTANRKGPANTLPPNANAQQSSDNPAIAQLVEHLTVDFCSNQMVPGSIPGGRKFFAGHVAAQAWRTCHFTQCGNAIQA